MFGKSPQRIIISATCRSAVQNSLNDAPFASVCVHCILKVANILYRCRKQGRTRVMWPLTYGLKTRLRVACASLNVFSCNSHPLSLAPPQWLVRLSLLLSYYTKGISIPHLYSIDTACFNKYNINTRREREIYIYIYIYHTDDYGLERATCNNVIQFAAAEQCAGSFWRACATELRPSATKYRAACSAVSGTTAAISTGSESSESSVKSCFLPWRRAIHCY